MRVRSEQIRFVNGSVDIVDNAMEGWMRVTSDEKLARASELRRDGKSWLQLSKSAKGKDAGLEFFRTSSSGKTPKSAKKVAA